MFARQLGAQAQVALNQYPQRSLLWAVEALSTTLRVNEPAEPLAEEALRMALSSVGGRVLVGHEGAVWPIVFSPDGHWLVTNDYGPTAYLWDLRAPDPAVAPRFLRGHEKGIFAIGVSPDGHWLATASGDMTIRLWDLTVPDPAASPRILRGHRSRIKAVAFSPDGRWLVSASEDKTARLWDLRDPDVSPRILSGHQGGVYNCESGRTFYITRSSKYHRLVKIRRFNEDGGRCAG